MKTVDLICTRLGSSGSSDGIIFHQFVYEPTKETTNSLYEWWADKDVRRISCHDETGGWDFNYHCRLIKITLSPDHKLIILTLIKE